MASMSDLSDQIAIDASKAATVTNDGVSVGRRSLADQIAADKYLRSVAAADATDPLAAFWSKQSVCVPPGGF
jgi:hypothetical protein